MSWIAIVPVKGSPAAKSRLGDHPARAELADAFAIDTVSALLSASVIARVFVVTADGSLAPRLTALGAEVLTESPPAGGVDPLNGAIRQATDAAVAAYPDAHVAIFTGDLPALTRADIETALGLAGAHELSMVPDEEGTGTTVLLARAGVPAVPRFGTGSRAAHEAAGHVVLNMPRGASIRRDVDTVGDLAEALHLGVGPHTSALIARSADFAG
ncbi:2-phospho-L-lactate guanylyltransferase [Glaciibacter sp. 2TAF33]|uniref:2-phospho-L-lactate guanylyltransferase n=1 Tax=Glaciibacter sp. 2TAF33 TaxID=3233015 RepID=UPI003F8FD804